MALILKGKNKGKEIELHQWCNDWFMVEDGKIYSPESIQLNPEEIDLFLKSDSGIMLGIYTLDISRGIFKKIKR